jgi:hypothetical protein
MEQVHRIKLFLKIVEILSTMKKDMVLIQKVVQYRNVSRVSK